MIIPFLFTLDEFGRQKPTYLWTFYKFMNFGKKYQYPIIAQEKFFGDLKDENNGHGARSENSLFTFEYDLPSGEQLAINKEYCITEEEQKRIINGYNSIEEAWIDLLKKENDNLIEILREKIKNIEKKHGEKVEAIFSWIWLPSVKKVANEMGISCIFYEFSTIRRPIYNCSLGYFQFCDKYDSTYVVNDFCEFKKNRCFLLNRRELLGLFLDKDHIQYLKYLYDEPDYRVGYALGLYNDKFEKAFSKYTATEVFEKLKHLYNKDEVLVRPHPQMDSNMEFDFPIDKSPDSSQWISRCETIISNLSNVAYEAMLYGRKNINIFKGLPSSFGEASSLDYIVEKSYSIEELNFLTFYCYAPYELMFDRDYIRWRLSKPSILEIYEYNLKYELRRHNIDFDRIKSLEKNERFKYILKNVQNIDDTKVDEYIHDSRLKRAKEDANEFQKITNQNENLEEIVKKLRADNTELWEEIQKQNKTIESIGLENTELRAAMEEINKSRVWKLRNKMKKMLKK